MTAETAKDYDPKVICFACTYCSYTAADLAGSMRLTYSPNVRVVKLLCTGKIDPLLLLRAFQQGADTVYVAGCNIGDCHFIKGNVAGKRWTNFVRNEMMEELGLEPERLEFFHVPASDGPGFANRANEMTDRARKLGPSPLKAFALKNKAETKPETKPKTEPKTKPEAGA
jgi:F420-non-reducing hydrogenase iron-sulfur subunit